MTDVLMALNAGSSSFKFALAACSAPAVPILSGAVERIGLGDAGLRIKGPDIDAVTRNLGAADHGAALAAVFDEMAASLPGLVIRGVGHRIVHGGERFEAPEVATDDVLDGIAALVPLAPLHQPHGLRGIQTGMDLYPDAVHVACFDTAFHATKPWVNQAYALPRTLFDDGLRRYGFHGLACQSIVDTLRRDGYPVADRKIAIAHLGNGCSVTAVAGGRSVATSMGFTALDGLPMGTRCGQIDPGVLLHLMRTGHDHDAIEALLYHQSGLRGLSGLSSDMRDLNAADSPTAKEAIDYFIARLVEEICRMAGAMGGLDAVMFSGGIGESDAAIRAAIAQRLAFLTGADSAGVDMRVCGADEERVLIEAAHRFVGPRP